MWFEENKVITTCMPACKIFSAKIVYYFLKRVFWIEKSNDHFIWQLWGLHSKIYERYLIGEDFVSFRNSSEIAIKILTISVCLTAPGAHYSKCWYDYCHEERSYFGIWQTRSSAGKRRQCICFFCSSRQIDAI